jgi:UDP-glucuronate 4-epimerase
LVRLIGQALRRAPVIERGPDQPGDVPRTAADLTRSAAVLGYRPTVGIDEGIPLFVRWYEATYGRQS